MNLLDLARSALAQRNADNAPHYRWRVTLPDGSALEVCCLPEMTTGELARCYPCARLMPLPGSPAKADVNVNRLRVS